MQPRSLALLWDARREARWIPRFAEGKSRDDYESDLLLRSALERQFQIIGEALSRLRQIDAETADLIPDLPRIVAFRNILVHRHAGIDDAQLWTVVTSELTPLVDLITGLPPREAS